MCTRQRDYAPLRKETYTHGTSGGGCGMSTESGIRSQLLQSLRTSGAVLLEEVGLCQGEARVDILAVSEHDLDGFEIKSEQDTLGRLPSQVEFYSRVLGRASIVAAAKHLNALPAIVPPWWGIVAAEPDRDGVCLLSLRQGSANPSPDPTALAQLLWYEEVEALLARVDALRGLRGKARRHLWGRLVERMPEPALRAAVCHALLTRERTFGRGASM